MLAMLYFPAEHTFAVYLPLFGVTLVPIIVAALKEVKAWRKERKERRQEKEVKTQ
jgi:GPI-anchor transamidase subunit S